MASQHIYTKAIEERGSIIKTLHRATDASNEFHIHISISLLIKLSDNFGNSALYIRYNKATVC